MPISVVFDPPLRSDSPAVFNSKAFTLVGDLNKWSNEANALASDVTSKQTTASNAATTATNQADLANSSRIAAQDAAAAAAASYDSFDDRYLGSKSADPTLDNDGAALIEGALYWNSTAKEMRTWNGTAWVTTSAANAVSRGGDTMTGNLTVPSINGGQLAGMRNKIINGKMEIAQRGTSFAAIATGAYSLDRWIYGGAGSQSITVSQETDVPSSNEFQSSIRLAVTTADPSIASGDYAHIVQRIEGFNARDLIGRTFTLSFWVRSSKTGTHCVSLRNSGLDRSYIAEYAISAANTWEQKSITINGGLIAAGTWNWTNGLGLDVGWTLATGSTFQTTPNAWQTGNFLATASQVNCLDTVGNIFAITGVQLEVGKVATPFEHRPIGTELALCQRYLPVLERGGGGSNGMALGQCYNTTSAVIVFNYQVRPRTQPTSVAISAASDFLMWQANTTGVAPTAIALLSADISSANLNVTGASGLVAGNATSLVGNSANAKILFNGCEL